MREIKLTSEDMPDVKRVYDAITDCIESMPDDLYGSDKFGLLVAQSLMNMICTVVHSAGVDKAELLKGIEDIWNGRYEVKSVMN